MNGYTILLTFFFKKEPISISLFNNKAPLIIIKTGTPNLTSAVNP